MATNLEIENLYGAQLAHDPFGDSGRALGMRLVAGEDIGNPELGPLQYRICADGVLFDSFTRKLYVREEGVESLTLSENRLLELLVVAPRVITPAYSTGEMAPNGRELRSTALALSRHIGRMKKKLNPYGDWLTSVGGVGYIYNGHYKKKAPEGALPRLPL